MAKRWYVIHTQTGFEDRVKKSLEYSLEHTQLKEKVHQILIPTEQVSEVREGKKKIFERKFFPGYILVQMDMDDETWYLIRNLPGVTGFVGSKTKPMPLDDSEVEAIIKQTEDAKEKPLPKIVFEKGESVRVKEGPFTNFTGVVDEVNPLKGKVRVTISIFGRSTPAELEYWQIEKI